MSHPPPKKQSSYFPSYWLLNRDPYNASLSSPHSVIPIYPEKFWAIALLICFHAYHCNDSTTKKFLIPSLPCAKGLLGFRHPFAFLQVASHQNSQQEPAFFQGPGRQVAVNFHQLYPYNQPRLPKKTMVHCVSRWVNFLSEI